MIKTKEAPKRIAREDMTDEEFDKEMANWGIKSYLKELEKEEK